MPSVFLNRLVGANGHGAPFNWHRPKVREIDSKSPSNRACNSSARRSTTSAAARAAYACHCSIEISAARIAKNRSHVRTADAHSYCRRVTCRHREQARSSERPALQHWYHVTQNTVATTQTSNLIATTMTTKARPARTTPSGARPAK